MNIIIGSYGPASARFGNLVMLRSEAPQVLQEIQNKFFKWKEYAFYIQEVYYRGESYGQIVARCTNVSTMNQLSARYVVLFPLLPEGDDNAKHARK